MKKNIWIIVVILILASIVLSLSKKVSDEETSNIPQTNNPDYKNIAYKIEGHKVTLKDGISEIVSAPSSASRLTVKYFGNEVIHDFDGDGRVDVAFLLTEDNGGSGTFYYLVAALNKMDGYVGSEAVFIGDRIAPQSTVMGNGNIIIVNYADRKAGESFAVAPSVGKSIWLLLDLETMQFGEVVQNFEGEADPSKMTLGMKTWNWISTTYGDGKIIKPKAENRFTLTLKADKTFSATTDCNGVGGDYTVKDKTITFSKMLSTMMFCEGSQEQDFTKALGEAQSFFFTSKGELVFNLKFDSGSMIFR